MGAPSCQSRLGMGRLRTPRSSPSRRAHDALVVEDQGRGLGQERAEADPPPTRRRTENDRGCRGGLSGGHRRLSVSPTHRDRSGRDRSENLNTERVDPSGRSRSRPRKRMAQRRPFIQRNEARNRQRAGRRRRHWIHLFVGLATRRVPHSRYRRRA